MNTIVNNISPQTENLNEEKILDPIETFAEQLEKIDIATYFCHFCTLEEMQKMKEKVIRNKKKEEREKKKLAKLQELQELTINECDEIQISEYDNN